MNEKNSLVEKFYQCFEDVELEQDDLFKWLPNPEKIKSQLNETAAKNLDFSQIETPSFLIDYDLLEDNLRYLENLQDCLDINIILAQKAYSLYDSYPLISKYLKGSTSSGLYEAKLAKKYMPNAELHVFSAAYKYDELVELYEIADYIIFNSLNQLRLYREILQKENLDKKSAPKIGLRLNPEKATGNTEIYDPASKGSRLGITASCLENELDSLDVLFDFADPRGNITGIHIHALCEQNSDALYQIVEASLINFPKLLEKISWLNLGGGHHFSKKTYDVKTFAKIVMALKTCLKDTKFYFEPGEAVVLDCGWLISEVQDIVRNGDEIAIIDASAECHCPDVLEMPYRPRAFLLNENDGSKKPCQDGFSTLSEEPYYRLADEDEDENSTSNRYDKCQLYKYRLGGPSCLAGDYFGYYSFKRRLKIKDRIVFCDMALYSFVKSNHFNGMIHPNIYSHYNGKYSLVKKFTFEDFESHLGE